MMANQEWNTIASQGAVMMDIEAYSQFESHDGLLPDMTRNLLTHTLGELPEHKGVSVEEYCKSLTTLAKSKFGDSIVNGSSFFAEQPPTEAQAPARKFTQE